ncbi:SDR family oxidoreductase [Ruania zhangjianzhongii]|uniref:SDR family oxidoreductase n=1 Tax=Ruania zhangjianzhongii TaxID=2603206 RepID=UPI0011C755F3|nr:SDR family oxidoreductase [Ruania zhangjianzhongii]
MVPGTDKVAVVTGGTAGVGRAAVHAFADAGYDVAILARGKAGLDAAVAAVRERGRRGLGIPTDVADAAAVHRAAAKVAGELGVIDVWVNVAFVGSLAYSWDTTDAELRRITEVTYLGQAHGTQAALAHMRPRDRGVIVNVGSALAYRSIPLQAAYCGAKHAVIGYTRSVITELASENSNVKLCTIQLPGLNTPQFNWNLNKMPGHPMPVPPIFSPEVAARGIVHIAEHPRRNMWVGLSTAYTILGDRLVPKLADLYLGRTGIAAQQTDPELPAWGSNLFEAQDADVDRGPDGPFPRQAHRRDPWLWLSMRRDLVLAGVLAVAGGAVAAAIRGRGSGTAPGGGGLRTR